MDVVLGTQCDDPALALNDVERFGDDSGFFATVAVVSNGFSARNRFYFGAPELRKCVADLEHMDATLQGVARLSQQFEPDYIEFSLDFSGHVFVSGELNQYGDLVQKLHFDFRTDQTVLAPLIRDLRACATMPVRTNE